LPKSLIPVAIAGSAHFQTALTNFLSLVGYYAAPFSAVLIVEHIVFRRSSGAAYDKSAWMSLQALPTGWAGVLSFAMSFALIVPSMDQVWFVGPIAKKGTGDIGFEVGFFSTALFYFILRSIDLKFISHGRLGGAPS
jgi:purine-cytosine permease-like protein